MIQFNDVANKMIDATKLLNSLYENDHNLNLPQIEYRVGSGKSTYYKKSHKNSKVTHTITYGTKMIEDKTDEKNLEGWLSSREIKKYGFFNGDLNIQNSLAQTVLHEYCHFITVYKYGMKKGEAHGSDFYRELILLSKKYAESIKKFLMQHECFADLKTQISTTHYDDNQSANNHDLSINDQVFFHYNSKKIYGIIVKINPKTYAVNTEIGEFRVSKNLLFKSDNLSEINVDTLNSASKERNFVKNQTISFIHNGTRVYGVIASVNKKTVTVIKGETRYRVPFQLIE